MELNKIIRRVLKEAVGVPDGVVETAEKVYNQVMKNIKSIGSIGEDEEISLGLNGDYNISDYEFKKIDLDLEIFRTPKVDVGTIAGMSFRFASQLNNKTLKLVHTPTENKIELTISIAIPEDGDLNSVIQELERNRQLSISSLSHELMHAYDKFKNPESHLTQRADYDTYKSIKFGIDPIDEFLHNLYFTHSIENIVRPSEVAADLKVGNIDKKGFLEFLKNNRVYKQLKEIYNFSYEGFKTELLDHVDLIRTRLEQSGLEDIPEDDYELVNTVLELLMINIVNGKAKSLKNDLTTDIFEELLGFSGKKEEVFRKYLKKIQKYENYDDFFKNEEKMFKQVSSNLMKKIHKLYSILGKGNQTNESIIDWDLYHEIKETPIVIETELNFEEDGRKTRLIQKYLDNIVVPQNKLICKAMVVRFEKNDGYLIRIWVNQNEPHTQDESDDLVDDTWEQIYNMFDVPTAVHRVKSEC
jgi:hypothetical protein